MDWAKFRLYSDLVMFSHSLFALPFAYLGAVLASRGLPSFPDVIWITLAMVGARNGANALNRLIDREFDAKNPRTANRHLPQGLVSVRETLILVGTCFILFVVAAWQLDPLAVKLLPVALFVLWIYSYTKRFTWGCHLVLGAAIGMAPAGAWIAVAGTIELPTIILGAVVASWVAGFDVIYATQDIEFDRAERLQSIPARFGRETAMWIAAFFHLGTLLLLLSLYAFFPLGWVYLAGVTAVAGLLLFEHLVAWGKLTLRGRPNAIELASYRVNQVVAPVLFLFTLFDVLLRP